jgi:hypothetical protein
LAFASAMARSPSFIVASTCWSRSTSGTRASSASSVEANERSSVAARQSVRERVRSASTSSGIRTLGPCFLPQHGPGRKHERRI